MRSDDQERKARAEVWRVWGPCIALTLIGFAAAWHFVKPGPPSSIRLATGTADGAYAQFGAKYRDVLARDGLEVTLVESAGTVDNLRMLRQGEVDVAFVQGGILDDDSSGTPTGVASLYYEPLWTFLRAGLEIARLSDLRGRRIQVGPEGSGTRAVALQLLRANGVTEDDAELLGMSGPDASQALTTGVLDALMVVGAPESPLVEELMQVEGDRVRLFDMERAGTYARRFRFLQDVTISEGLFDLAANRPDRTVRTVAPLATLLAADTLHPSIFPLLIEAARTVHGQGDAFADPGQFPSPYHLDVPVARAAARYFKSGPSFLYRWLPFRAAAVIDRLKIMLLPLLTLLLPLFKFAPPLYRWRIRSKIYRWYRVLMQIERKTRHARSPADVAPVLDEIRTIEEEILQVSVPPSYMEELYNLRMHLARVREDLDDARAGRPHKSR